MAADVFQLGRLVATPGALETVDAIEMERMVQRHASCDWGDCCEDDCEANDKALRYGGRLFSVYISKSGEKVWIITEADRSSTCLLLPSEY